MNKEERNAYMKKYYQANKDQLLEQAKAHYQAHKEENKAYKKAWQAANKEQYNAYQKEYTKSDVNSLGQTKQSIRYKSRRILNTSDIKIPGYQVHHCFTYDDPSKFIYCSKSLHLKIHQFLRDNNIDADTDHYDQIKHLLDDTVVVFGV